MSCLFLNLLSQSKAHMQYQTQNVVLLLFSQTPVAPFTNMV